MELNAFSASIKGTASVSTSANTSLMTWIADSAPASWPALSCKDPKALVTCLLHNITTILPTILLSTSPKPAGLKLGFLSNGFNLLVARASRGCVDCRSPEQSVLMKFEEILQRSLDEFQNCPEVNILCQPSASRPYGPEPPFFNIAAGMTKDSLMSSYVIACSSLNGPCRSVSGEDSSGSRCFCFSKSRVLLD